MGAPKPVPLHEDDVYAVVREFMKDHGRDPTLIEPKVELRALGIDSLGAVDLAFRFEDRFGIVIPMESFPLTTVDDAVRFVVGLSEQASAAAR